MSTIVMLLCNLSPEPFHLANLKLCTHWTTPLSPSPDPCQAQCHVLVQQEGPHFKLGTCWYHVVGLLHLQNHKPCEQLFVLNFPGSGICHGNGPRWKECSGSSDLCFSDGRGELLKDGNCQASLWQGHCSSLCDWLALCAKILWDFENYLVSCTWWFLCETVIVRMITRGWLTNSVSSVFLAILLWRDFPYPVLIY